MSSIILSTFNSHPTVSSHLSLASLGPSHYFTKDPVHVKTHQHKTSTISKMDPTIIFSALVRSQSYPTCPTCIAVRQCYASSNQLAGQISGKSMSADWPANMPIFSCTMRSSQQYIICIWLLVICQRKHSRKVVGDHISTSIGFYALPTQVMIPCLQAYLILSVRIWVFIPLSGYIGSGTNGREQIKVTSKLLGCGGQFVHIIDAVDPSAVEPCELSTPPWPQT